MTVSNYPTETFNPVLCICVNSFNGYGKDYYDMTLKEAIDKLIIYGDLLIFKSQEERFINYWKHKTPKYGLQANLYNLINHEFLHDIPTEYRDWCEKANRFLPVL